MKRNQLKIFSLFVFIFFFVWMFFSGCLSPLPKHTNQKNQKVNLLDTILKQKKIIALTDYGASNFFIYKGQTMGYQYNLLQHFAKWLGVSVDLRIQENLDTAISLLQQGKVDLLAMGLTVTSQRMKNLAFTHPLFYTRQVLVQRKPKGYKKMKTADEINKYLIRNPMELAGKTVYVQKGTIFYSHLLDMQNQIADTIHIIQDTLDTESLIKAVANGKINYTVADEIVARVAAKIYPNLDVNTPLSFDQKIAWAVRKDQKPLLDTINRWLSKFNRTLQSRLLYNKYFKNMATKSISIAKYWSFKGGHLSPYDSEIKLAAQKLGWDWRLLAAIIYQESGFKKNQRSWVGAYGLMQLMPEAMKNYNITVNSSPKEQILAGVKLLKSIEKKLPDSITGINRIKFTLAAYNGGISHIMDARALAKKYGKNPDIWNNNVDYYVLHLSEKHFYHDPVVKNGYMRGWETYKFVKDIMKRYNNYKKLIKPDKNKKVRHKK